MALKAVIEKYSKTLLLRQGENGAPSGYIPSFALDKYYWTEYSQAKYDMRRLLGDLGRDIETSVFTIIDIRYAFNPPVLNMKGLIQSDLDKTAIRPKVAYYAVQNVTSVFDNTLELVPNARPTTTTTESISIFQYRQKAGKKQLVSVWLDSKTPNNLFQTTPIDITIPNGNFDNPVWVDLLTGHMYEIPKGSWKKSGTTYTFSNVPVYDSPVLIADKNLIISQ